MKRNIIISTIVGIAAIVGASLFLPHLFMPFQVLRH